MKAYVRHLQGVTFIAKADSKHWVTIDGPEEFGGSEAASRPMELILFGFAGCAGSDIASILKKMRMNIEQFEIEVDAERADEHPQVFTKIHLKFVFTGKNLKEKNIERAIELTSTQYCPVWAMLKNSVDITFSYEIQEND